MAAIIQRKDRFCVVYSYETQDGQHKQKWETYKSMADARRRQAEVEYHAQLGTLIVSDCRTLDDLLKEYVELYGKPKWSISMYRSSMGYINHYISPIIGHMKLHDITARVLEKYYMDLLKTKAVPKATDRKYNRQETYVTPSTVKKIHNLLRSCFHQAVKWDLMEKNPALYATVPKSEEKKRDIWDAPTLLHAIEICEDERLKMAMNLSFSCSLRIGEILGLTWDCVDVSEESMADGSASIYVNKELQRADKHILEALDDKDVIFRFPEQGENNRSVLILKKPKTRTSVRKVFLPATVANMLIDWKQKQEDTKEALGDEYQDFDLVLAGPLGMPTENARLQTSFKRLIRDNDLPDVVFHSLRHTSITYKLKLTGGDIKAVQGDSGHAQARMVTDQYSHILDDDRMENARLIEEAFYSGHAAEPRAASKTAALELPAGLDMDLLNKIAENPQLVELLKTFAAQL